MEKSEIVDRIVSIISDDLLKDVEMRLEDNKSDYDSIIITTPLPLIVWRQKISFLPALKQQVNCTILVLRQSLPHFFERLEYRLAKSNLIQTFFASSFRILRRF